MTRKHYSKIFITLFVWTLKARSERRHVCFECVVFYPCLCDAIVIGCIVLADYKLRLLKFFILIIIRNKQPPDNNKNKHTHKRAHTHTHTHAHAHAHTHTHTPQTKVKADKFEHPKITRGKNRIGTWHFMPSQPQQVPTGKNKMYCCHKWYSDSLVTTFHCWGDRRRLGKMQLKGNREGRNFGS